MGLKGGWPYSDTDTVKKSTTVNPSEDDVIMQPAEQCEAMANRGINGEKGSSEKEVLHEVSALLEECIARVSDWSIIYH